MFSLHRLLVLPILAIASACALPACIYEDKPPRRLDGADDRDDYEDDTSGSSGSSGSGGGSTGTGTVPPTSTAPMLVEVDTDETMTADPGQGVGVFVEYKAGGHWHLWWTCDTARTRQGCEFAVSASLASGSITNVDGTELTGGFLTTPSPSRVDASSSTTNEVHGITFDTAAGATLTVQATVSGIKDGAFLFFVQDGKVNGGYTGKLSNPLQLQGKSP